MLEYENTTRGQLYKKWEENDVKVEEFMLDDAEYVIVAYGISARVSREAILRLRKEGFKVGMIRPITLYPFPKKSLQNLDFDRVKGIIDIELAIPAQMRDDIALEVKDRAPVYTYGHSGGILLDDESTYNAIKKIVTGGAE